MIISASYKTDIPTFYGEWFMNRLREGSCKMVNPYGRQVYTISLKREGVDGFVFWTKNIGPFLKYLPEIRESGYPFVVQHSINGYPRQLEFRVIDYSRTVEHMHTLACEYGPHVAIWRYDPIVFSSLTPPNWHRDNFAKLAQALEGTTDEVVISFAQIYRKTRRNMDWAANEFGFIWRDDEQSDHERIVEQEGRDFAIELFHIASKHEIQLKICSQKAFLVPGVVTEARCVDAERLDRVARWFGLATEKRIEGKPHKGNRKECACHTSKDIGEYDTCPHGCVYCYAVQNRDLALQRYKEYNKDGEFLFKPKDVALTESEEVEAAQVIPVSKVSKRAAAKGSYAGTLFDDVNSQ